MLRYIDSFPASSEMIKPRRLSEQPTVHPSARIRHSAVGSWTDIGPNTSIVESMFDDYSYAAGDVSIIYSEVGKFCSIASHARINPGNHPMHRVTQHHSTYRRVQYGFDEADDKAFFDWRRSHRCIIGHDVWIGHGAIVLPGVQIGIGAVVGAGAVVAKDVEPYEIVVGVPARPVRKRFPPDVVEKLLEIAWWTWDRATLESRFQDLLDMDDFLAKHAGTHVESSVGLGR